MLQSRGLTDENTAARLTVKRGDLLVESDDFEPTQDSLVRIAQLRRKGLSYAEAVVWHAVEERGLSKRALSDESESEFSMDVSRGSIQTPHTRAEAKLDH